MIVEIKGFEEYCITHDGLVYSKYLEDFMKLGINEKGYSIVSLSKNNKTYVRKVHKLVAEAFIPNPNNKPEVNHKKGIKSNNHFWNLEWSTRSENLKHAYSTGLREPIHHENHPSSIKILQLTKEGVNIGVWDSMSQAAKALNLHTSRICAVCNGRRETHGGFKWKRFNS